MKDVRHEIARFLQEQGVFNKTAVVRGLGRGAKSLAMAHRGKLGLGVGAGAVAGVHNLGKKEQQAQQEAAELNQLLEAYPELLYTTPTAFDSPEYGDDEPQQQYYNPSVY